MVKTYDLLSLTKHDGGHYTVKPRQAAVEAKKGPVPFLAAA
jgi:hypothetical protein